MKSGGNIKLRSYETAQEAKRQKNWKFTCKNSVSTSGNHVKKKIPQSGIYILTVIQTRIRIYISNLTGKISEKYLNWLRNWAQNVGWRIFCVKI
jgi:hypothetical protein